MRQLSLAASVVTVAFVCSLVLAADAKNAQQVGEDPRTFVVRYKNGDQTIPVTVVLDYKKQTEYVINMNPRTPTKSVTLYDFKQRTIAYKDLTNRECFLGRLTYETLKEEADALNKIQNPVDHRPKLLMLDPQKPALTPTEIRNLAGQRTAVFCRRMNTWLVRPPHSHRVRKREAEEEVEERTFHRHGFRTVSYSHFGRETRRRVSRRNGTRQSSYDHENTSNDTSRTPGLFDEDSFFGERFPPFHHPSIPVIHGGRPLDSQHRITERTPDEHRHPSRSGLYDFSAPSASNATSNGGDPSSALYSRSPVFTEDTLGPRHYPEPPSFRGSPPQRIDLSPIPAHRNIESEWSPNASFYVPETHPHIPKSIPENPDVSTNVLEISKNTNTFENFDHHPASQVAIPPTNEDVHDLFEGFYNLQGKAPGNGHLPKDHFHGSSPHLSHPGINYEPSFVRSDGVSSIGRDISRAPSTEPPYALQREPPTHRGLDQGRASHHAPPYVAPRQRSDIPSEAEGAFGRQGGGHPPSSAQDSLSGYKPDEIVIHLGDLSTEGSRGAVRADPPSRRPAGGPHPSRRPSRRPPPRDPQRRGHALGGLPPGVSIHPRHPQAPYADMFQSNIPPALVSDNGYQTAKAHRLRHFRKQNRLTNCCRMSGGNCCRGSCCNGKAPRTPCCSSGHRGPPPPRRNQVPLNFPPAELAAHPRNRQARRLEQPTRPLNDAPQPTAAVAEERCQRMCRTAYESTQQVIVCRNVNGC